MICFTASQSVVIRVPDQPISIEHYLRQPRRLVKALVDPRQTEILSSNVFRYRMRPFQFLVLRIQPIVDLQIIAQHQGRIDLESVRCELLGNDYINQRFKLSLNGYLIPERTPQGTQLRGTAHLQVSVELPPPLRLTPKPLLEATGNGLLRSVLLTIKQRLMRQLLDDYCQWVVTQPKELCSTMSSLASQNHP